MAANAASQVSQGALRTIFEAGNAPEGSLPHPVLQCVQIKPLASQQPNGPERYRVVFSDIKNFIQSILATQANWLVQQDKLKKGCFVRLKSFQSSEVKGRKIIVVLDLDVLEELGDCEKIGDPKPLEPKSEDESKGQPGAISSNGFYGNKPQTQQQQSRSLPSRTGGMNGSSAHANIYPIEALSPYTHKWTIRVRCTHKSDIKHWHNKNGEGKLFSVNLLDDSGEIRATGFKEQCDTLYELFQEGSVYYISSPCKVQLAKKQFTNLNNDYEMMFERDTMVEKAEDQTNVPQVRFNFTSIGDLQSVEKDTTIDTIGVLREVGETSQITSKTTSKPYDKRELTLVDSSNFSVRLTVWGQTATSFDVPENSIIAFKGVKVSDFGGRSLSLLHSGSMAVDPDIDDAHKLKGWYDAQGQSDNFTSHASMAGATGTAGGRKEAYKTIAQVEYENLGMGEKADYFTMKATVVYFKQEPFCYPACLLPDCNKKVLDMGDHWRCEKCDKNHPHPEWRYMMSLNVNDHTGQMWLTAFDDIGRVLLGRPAGELREIKENDEQAAVEAFQDNLCKTWIFRCKAKMETFQDQQKVRYSIASAQPLNFSAEAAKLADIIKLYNID
ncbi:MAG: Replication factor A protein 1 [Piccolia ochrophora]|nr:MAG: Replication factor A protein 1 [Piccolia ochrophora]